MKQIRTTFILLFLIPGLFITGCSFSPAAVSSDTVATQTEDATSTETVTESETEITIPDMTIALPTEEEEPELTEEEKAAIRRTEELVPLLEEAAQLAQGFYYDEAIEYLKNAPEEFARDEELLGQIEE